MQITLGTSRYSRTSLTLTVAGLVLFGVSVSKATETIDGEWMKGNSIVPLGRVLKGVSSEFEIAVLPETFDTLVQQLGPGYAQFPIDLDCTLYDPANPAGAYEFSNGLCYISETSLDIAEGGAVMTMKLAGGELTNWNGITSVDLTNMATDPGSVAELFAAAGLAI